MSGTRSAELKLTIDFKGTIQNTLIDGQAATCAVGEKIVNTTYADGVSINKVSRLWEDRDREITSGNHHELDLFDFTGEDIGAGSGNDAIGQALSLQEVVTFIVKHESGAGSLEIRPNAAANGWTPCPILTVALGGALKVGSSLVMHNPAEDAFSVSAGSCIVHLKAVGGDVTYSVYVAGRHDTDESSSSSTSSLSSASSQSSSTSSSTSSFSSSSTSSVNSSSSSVNSSSSSTSTQSSSSSSSSSTSSVNSSSSSSSSSSTS